MDDEVKLDLTQHQTVLDYWLLDWIQQEALLRILHFFFCF